MRKKYPQINEISMHTEKNSKHDLTNNEKLEERSIVIHFMLKRLGGPNNIQFLLKLNCYTYITIYTISILYI